MSCENCKKENKKLWDSIEELWDAIDKIREEIENAK